MIAAPDLSIARKRLRWRARRGVLENDLILARFFSRHGDELTNKDMLSIEALLDLPENELLEILLARSDLPDALATPDIQTMLHRLRSA